MRKILLPLSIDPCLLRVKPIKGSVRKGANILKTSRRKIIAQMGNKNLIRIPFFKELTAAVDDGNVTKTSMA
tara:strand:- start:2377 stop:2592 length:216 start_codon:yes stop_codon:yes gene_type:complete